MNFAWSIGKCSDIFSWYSKKLRWISEIFREIPDISIFEELWELKELISEISSDNFSFYVGQIFTKDVWLYDDDFIVWAIAEYLRYLKEWEKINISNASEVSWLINWLKEEDWAISPEKQISYIEELLATYIPQYQDFISIENLSYRHEELFEALKIGLLEWLTQDSEIVLDDDSSSLDIAKLLYKATEKNNKFFLKLASTNSKRIKWERYNKSDIKNYYALIEIAIRIKDYLDGIHIQWWEARQKEYDQIIVSILKWGYDKTEELKRLKEFCNNKTDLPFCNFNFSKNKYKKEIERKKRQKDFIKKFTWISLGIIWSVSLIVWWWVWGFIYHEHRERQEIKEKMNTILSEAVWDKVISTCIDRKFLQKYTTKEEKELYLYKVWERAASIFLKRYWKWNITEDELIYFFTLKIIENNYFPNLTDNNFYVRFIEEILAINSNRYILLSDGFSVDNDYLKHSDRRKDFHLTHHSNVAFWDITEGDLEEAFEYVDTKWYSYKACVYNYLWNRYIVAKECDDYCEYSLELWKKVSLDFLSSPVNLIVRDIIYIWNSINFGFLEVEEDIRRKLVELIDSWEYSIKDIKNWRLIHKMSFLSKYFWDDLLLNIWEVTKNTLYLDRETIDEITELKEDSRLHFKTIWKTKIWSTYYNLSIIQFRWKKYFFLDFENNVWTEWLRLYGYININDAKQFSKELLELL